MGDALLNLVKGFFTIIALPIIIGLTWSFGQELEKFTLFSLEFKAGILTYVLAYFFIASLKVVYNIGQKIISLALRFSKPLSETVPHFLPFFTIIILVVLWLATANHWHFRFEEYSVFLVGFTLAMHIILTAQTLREEDSNPFKAHYFMLITLVYMVNLTLIVWFLSWGSNKISLQSFWADALIHAKDIYLLLGRSLF